ACQNCCPRPTSKWPLPLDAGATGTPVASHFFIVVTECGRRHLLQRGGRSCPNEARPAPITPLEATGACPWPGWPGPLARQEPGAEAAGKAQGVVSYKHLQVLHRERSLRYCNTIRPTSDSICHRRGPHGRSSGPLPWLAPLREEERLGLGQHSTL
ncbi:hypothetical protein TRIATDRAFT_320225, partial [Trichoderma atroviride IMI 206040]